MQSIKQGGTKRKNYEILETYGETFKIIVRSKMTNDFGKNPYWDKSTVVITLK